MRERQVWASNTEAGGLRIHTEIIWDRTLWIYTQQHGQTPKTEPNEINQNQHDLEPVDTPAGKYPTPFTETQTHLGTALHTVGLSAGTGVGKWGQDEDTARTVALCPHLRKRSK